MRGRKPDPAAVRAAKNAAEPESREEARRLYADLSRRQLQAAEKVREQGAVLSTEKGYLYRNPWCLELDKVHAEMRALMKSGLMTAEDAKAVGDPDDDDDVADLLD